MFRTTPLYHQIYLIYGTVLSIFVSPANDHSICKRRSSNAHDKMTSSAIFIGYLALIKNNMHCTSCKVTLRVAAVAAKEVAALGVAAVFCYNVMFLIALRRAHYHRLLHV